MYAIVFLSPGLLPPTTASIPTCSTIPVGAEPRPCTQDGANCKKLIVPVGSVPIEFPFMVTFPKPDTTMPELEKFSMRLLLIVPCILPELGGL